MLCHRADVCYQRTCCIEKGIEGCWECPEFPCGLDVQSPPFDLRIRAFVNFIKTEGKESLIDCLLRNEENGIYYGLGRDYDGKDSEEEVITLLDTDRSS